MVDQRVVRRNVGLLAAGMAALYGMTQLTAAMATLTFVLVTHIDALVGLGPAIFLAAGALTALPAGRAMDRFGRVPVLAAGFISGLIGALLTAYAAHRESTVAVVIGFMFIGAGVGTVMLSRLAAADMFPPAHRARGIGLALMGAVVGALLGPFVFMPLFAGKSVTAAALVLPWIAASGFMLLGLFFVLNVRPDPREIAKQLANEGVSASGGVTHATTPMATPVSASLVQLLKRPGVLPAVIAAQASVAVMVALMTLAGYIMVGHGHHQESVFPAISAHFIGMFGLVLIVGRIIDKVGRTRALVAGLLILAPSVLALIWLTGVVGASVAMFGIGLGWNFAYVAATAELVDLTAPTERGRLLGFSDLLAGLSGAALALLGGYGLHAFGLAAVCLVGFALCAMPALWIVWERPRRVVHAV